MSEKARAGKTSRPHRRARRLLRRAGRILTKGLAGAQTFSRKLFQRNAVIPSLGAVSSVSTYACPCPAYVSTPLGPVRRPLELVIGPGSAPITALLPGPRVDKRSCWNDEAPGRGCPGSRPRPRLDSPPSLISSRLQRRRRSTAPAGLANRWWAAHIAPPRGRRVGTTGTGANLRARRRRPAASTCEPLQNGACAAGTAGASGSGRRPKARSLQLYNL